MSIMATDLEKKSLETHVDLCAARYRFLEDKLLDVDHKVTKLEDTVQAIHDLVVELSVKRNDQVIAWGVGIIAGLLGIVGWLLSKYVLI